MNKYLGSLNWSKGSRVNFSKNSTRVFVEELAEKAKPSGFRVYVTSAYRSPADQARVVCNNVQNTNGANLSVYGQTTRNMYRANCPGNMQALVDYEAGKLARNIARDPNYQGHGTGYAVDLSVSGMSNSQKVAYKRLIESMGAEVLWEKSPEHFHVWLKNWKPKTDYGWTRILAFGGFGIAFGLSGYLAYLIADRKGYIDPLKEGASRKYGDFKELIGSTNINEELTRAFSSQFGAGSLNESRPKSITEMFLSAEPSMVSDENLVAILIYGTTGSKNPLNMAREMLESVEGHLPQLISGSFLGNPKFNNSSKAKMIAAAELAKRANYRAFLAGKSDSITSPDALYRAFKEMGTSVGLQEVMSVIYLNQQSQIIGSEVVSRGSHRFTLADPSYIIGQALKKNARSIAMAHNHPSGSPVFSQADIEICKKLNESANCVGIKLIDFLAIGKNDTYRSAMALGII